MRVRVPATSANLGPGFDALGLALRWYDDVVLEAHDDAVVVDVTGEGADAVDRGAANLVVRAAVAAFDAMGVRPAGLALTCTNRIPHARGLGSSAAAIVAGASAARALVAGGSELLDDAALLQLCSDLEGHPDNVAACLLGGLTIAYMVDGVPRAVRLSVRPEIAPVLLIPPTTASTTQARGMLPDLVPHAVAAANAGRAALLVAALTVDPGLLLAATEDRLHQAYRAPAMPETADLVTALRADGIPAAVSGAGPTVLALPLSGDAAQLSSRAPSGWSAHVVDVDTGGAQVSIRVDVIISSWVGDTRGSRWQRRNALSTAGVTLQAHQMPDGPGAQSLRLLDPALPPAVPAGSYLDRVHGGSLPPPSAIKIGVVTELVLVPTASWVLPSPCFPSRRREIPGQDPGQHDRGDRPERPTPAPWEGPT